MISGFIFLDNLTIANKDFRTFLIRRSTSFTPWFVIVKNGFSLFKTARVTSYLFVSILLQMMETFLSSPPHSRVGTTMSNFIFAGMLNTLRSFLFPYIDQVFPDRFGKYFFKLVGGIMKKTPVAIPLYVNPFTPYN